MAKQLLAPAPRVFVKFCRSAAFHLYTIWLFTLSDLKTIVFPSTVFAVVHGLALRRLGLIPGDLDLPRQIPYVLFWSWINLLPFNVNNQMQPDSVVEDAKNKPWRPLPSKRLRPADAARLMYLFYALALLSSVQLGSQFQCIALMVLGWWYNCGNGADARWLVRNVINGLGYLSFISGALTIILRDNQRPVHHLAWWYAVIFLVLCTTVQCQDMYDQKGDAVRGRKTAPLVIGDGAARISIAVSVLSWGVITPWMWRCSFACYILLVLVGSAVAYNSLMQRTVSADKTTFRLWNLWLTLIFCLPFFSTLDVPWVV